MLTARDPDEVADIYPDCTPEELELLVQLPLPTARDVYNEGLGDHVPKDEFVYGDIYILARVDQALTEPEAVAKAIAQNPEAANADHFRTARYWVFFRAA